MLIASTQANTVLYVQHTVAVTGPSAMSRLYLQRSFANVTTYNHSVMISLAFERFLNVRFEGNFGGKFVSGGNEARGTKRRRD